jgi:serine/threonine-protein kinase
MLEDLRRWRAGLPVRAVGDGVAYRARRFVGRNRLAVLVSGAALVVAAAFVIATGVRLAEQERAARTQAERAGAVAAFLADLFRAGDPLRRGGPEPRVRDLLDRGAERLDRELRASPEVRDSMRLVLGQAYLGLGDTVAARPLLEQALAGRRERHGADHPDLAEVWLGLAEAARIERRHDDAETALANALRLVREVELTTRVGVERARLARDRGRHEEALALIAAARESLLGGASSSLVYEVDAVEGSIYFDQGRHREAAERLERAADAARGDAAMEAQLATALGLLAGSELYLGRPMRARDALTEAVALWDHTVGSHHPEALLARANLAGVYAEIGEPERAIELAEEVEGAAATVGDRVALARAEVAGGLARLAQSDASGKGQADAIAAVAHGGALLASRFGSAATARIWADLGDQLWQAGARADGLSWWHRAWQAADWPAGDTRRIDLGWREVRVRLEAGDEAGAGELLTRLETESGAVILEGTLAWAQLLMIRAELERQRGRATSEALLNQLESAIAGMDRIDPRGAAMAAGDLAALHELGAAR